MEDDNVHTSIVIKMGNQEKLEDQKLHFNEGNVPKDYVIDQIFCGDNITIYALLEISDDMNGFCDKQLLKMNSSSVRDSFSFFHGNSFKEATIDKKNIRKKKFDLKMKNSETNIRLHPRKNSRKKSFYCLKHLENRYRISNSIDDTTDMKILYSKEMPLNGRNLIKTKTTSKGVNTDIAQSPKLLDKVKQAISGNYPFIKKKNKALDSSSHSTVKLCNEMDEKWSNSTLSSEGDNTKFKRQSSSNFLLVPLIMMEEGMLSQFLKDNKSSTLSKKTTLSCSSHANPAKVSFGVNTDFSSLETLNQEKLKKRNSNESEKVLMIDHSTGDLEQIKKEENCCDKNLPDVENKETILEEIRNLQCQLHALVKSLERRDLNIDDTITKSGENTTVAATSRSEIDEVEPKEKPDLLFLKPNISPTRVNKFDDLHIVSPNGFPYQSNRGNQKNTKKLDIKKSVQFSKSSTATSSTFNTSSLKSILERQKENDDVKLHLKEEFEFFDSERESFSKKWKGVYLSKSDFSCRYTFSELKYFSCQVIKKSHSLDQRQEKPDLLSVKKLKNISFKQEGILKGKNNSRLHQPMENSLLESLTPLKCEMGDEVAKNCKGFTSSELNTYLIEKKSTKDSEKKIKNTEKYNEEEGDAKLANQKHRLAIPKFVHKNERITAQFCSTLTDSPIKQCNNLSEIKTKEKIESLTEWDIKISNEPEKTNFLKTEHRKLNYSDAENKKEKNSKKNCRKLPDKQVKYEKKDLREVTKQKSVVGSRKSLIGNSAYSKLHINRLIKNEGNSNVRSDISTGNNKSVAQSSRKLQDKKSYTISHVINPETSLSYTISNRHRDNQVYETPTPPCDNSKKKIRYSSTKNSKSLFDENDAKCSLRNNLGEQISDEILDFDKKIEDIFLSDNFPIPQNSNMLDSSHSSSVVLEVLPKKPDSEDDLFFDIVSQECKNINSNENAVSTEISTNKKVSDTTEKPIAKSVWALTKVLLFEDGTKQFEVLEASLTPPDYLV